MTWFLLALAMLILGVIIAGYPKMKTDREPQREGPQDPHVVKAYNRLSRWPIHRAERHIALKFLKKLHPEGILIDVGCGPGYLVDSISHQFPQLRVIGIDINQDMLAQARHNFPASERAWFRHGDAQALPCSNEEVDFVISTGAFHHWGNAARSLREFHRVLKPGGQLLILDLRRDARRWFYWLANLVQLTMPRDIQRVNGAVGSVWSSYTPAEMEGLFSQSPFNGGKIRPQLGWMFVWARK
jgi:ubiquinone/menaquinone biosynthesis C-methylase UbiE